MTAVDEGHCPKSVAGSHCQHWWDGEACCWCHAPEMSMEDRVAQGMAEGPVRRPNERGPGEVSRGQRRDGNLGTGSDEPACPASRRARGSQVSTLRPERQLPPKLGGWGVSTSLERAEVVPGLARDGRQAARERDRPTRVTGLSGGSVLRASPVRGEPSASRI
jgi:hypothetical protein